MQQGTVAKVPKLNFTNYRALPACGTMGKSIKDSQKARRACHPDPVIIILRTDAGFGTGPNITWLIEMGYIVCTKAYNAQVATKPNGVGSEFQPMIDEMNLAADQAVLARYGIVPPYILALGNIHPRKNLARLLEAYLYLRQCRKDAPSLVWAGSQRWGSGELLERARSAGVILTGFVAQEDLPALYRQAMMLVYPSLYEGFGLPPLEAMACGTPVVTSNTTSLPETVGKAALAVDPTDAKVIASAIRRLLDDVSLRKHLRQAGLEWASQFTWTRTAQSLVSSLDS